LIYTRVGIDAHKMKYTTVMFDGDSVTGSFAVCILKMFVFAKSEPIQLNLSNANLAGANLQGIKISHSGLASTNL